jgi:hypothetical protein
MKVLLTLATIIGLFFHFGDELEHNYNKLTWKPPMEINGIASGMTRSDVMFKLGETMCTKYNTTCHWVNHKVLFRNDLVHVQNTESVPSIPFKNTKDMKDLLGDEDLFAESKDFSTRRYTYLKWGATFVFKNDALTGYMVGKVTWRPVTPLGKYVIKGVVVCPSADCPYDDRGDLKEDFKDRDYTYFIK